jgi:predicted GNAT family acetyltransferase
VLAVSSGPQIVDNVEASRFEATVDGHLAELVYRREGDRLVLVHTGVPDELEGHGIGGQLVEAAVDSARDRHLTVVPLCPFARRWIERHPECAAGVTVELPNARGQR